MNVGDNIPIVFGGDFSQPSMSSPLVFDSVENVISSP